MPLTFSTFWMKYIFGRERTISSTSVIVGDLNENTSTRICASFKPGDGPTVIGYAIQFSLLYAPE